MIATLSQENVKSSVTITFDWSIQTKATKTAGRRTQFSPHDGLASGVRVVEHLVPEGQEGVALTNNVTNHVGVFGTVQPRLTPRRVHVGVGPEEGHVAPSLVPAHQQLRARSVEEAADVGCEGQKSQRACLCQTEENKPQARIHLLNGAGYRTRRYRSHHRMNLNVIQCII